MLFCRYLWSNKISALDVNIFQGLTSLKILWLSSNQIETLDENIFNGLTALEYLHLQNNRIVTLDVNLFNGLTALIELKLENNPLNCSMCMMKKFKDFLQRNNDFGYSGARCEGEANLLINQNFTNCKVMKCTAPGINEFTITSTNTDVVPSTEVTYTCKFGYQLPAGDLGTRICQLGGTWPAPPPACEVIKCTAPGLNEFTITSTNTDVVPSTEVTYTCKFGYQLPAGDSGTRRCQLRWYIASTSTSIYKCTAPGLNEFTITSTNTDVVPSTEVTYTCEFGYQLPAGDLGTRRCQLGGTWPAPPPACEVIKCTAPELNEFTITSTNTDVVPSTEVTYTCKFGYQLPAGDLGTRICQLGGTWPAPPPACEGKNYLPLIII
ncbi:CSMD [Mytilus edulis]|uniref:CSMD n=1 Tax=Mytilus edulis TaxID=6550 RepID=A0A8S3VEK8_MYTED|nr:CSMD [Mytilus edulis]